MYTRLCLVFAVSCPAVVFAELPAASSHALSFLAPEGRWAARLEYRVNGYDKFYASNAGRNDLGAELHAVDLDGQVFPALQVFGSGATLGTTQFNTDVSVRRLELTLGYGFNADLTFGVIVPYGETRTRGSFSVSGGNVGFNPSYDPSQPTGASNFPFAPVGAGATTPVGTEGVQTILTDPAFGYAYERLDDARWRGAGDPTLGLLWRFYKSGIDSLVFGFGYRFGIAADDNPDILLDVPVDDGSDDIRLRLEYYRDLSSGYDLQLKIEHDVQLEDNVTRRVPAPGELLATSASRESLMRDPGDYWEYDIGLGKAVGDWRFGATWHRYVKAADDYSSSMGTDVSALEVNTDIFANQWRATVSWSGIRAWQAGNFPLPLIVQLELQETYAARNFPDVRDLYLQVNSFF